MAWEKGVFKLRGAVIFPLLLWEQKNGLNGTEIVKCYQI